MSTSEQTTKRRKLRVAISCGGSGGHINPGLATAQVLLERGHEVFIVSSGRKSEIEPLKAWKGENFKTGVSQSVRSWPAGFFKCVRLFLKKKPDVLLAMGCYTSASPCMAAKFTLTPVVLHEANAVPGRANAFLAGMAKAIGITFPESRRHLSSCRNIVETGLPLRLKFTRGCGTSKADPKSFTLLVTGGSQGARDMNRLVAEAIGRVFMRKSPLAARLKVVHLAGKGNEEAVRDSYAAAKVPAGQVEVLGFSNEMERLYAESDFCISRSGASACFELALAGLPALFVPLENLAGDHQSFNARFMASAKAGDWKAQHELTPEWLADYIEKIAADRERRDAIRAAQLSVVRNDAASALADLVESSAKRGKEQE